jgi:outer membrane protein OmpA-like peptidoglycan-associated protein
MTRSACLLASTALASALVLGAPGASAAGAAPAEEPPFSRPLRLHGSLGAARALTGYQASELGFGAEVSVALEWALLPALGLELSAGWLGLAAVDAPAPDGLAPLDGEDAGSLALGVRVHPFGVPRRWLDPAGLWLAAAGGGALTGGRVVPLVEARLGYDVFPRSNLGVGPYAGYSHYFAVGEVVREGDASVLSFGVHGAWELSRPRELEPLGPVDRDADGVLDDVDRCPAESEDRDGFEDADGCPDLDDDADGVLDGADRCPREPEDADGFEDEDGCPDPDDDGDGVLDADDACREAPEDRDGYEDENGCPDEDNDRDGIADGRDLCPLEPETMNGFSDNDGCPDSESVRVVGDKIELDQRIHFWSDSAKIRAMSYPVLDKLARFLAEHPEYTHVSIEGHADARGPDDLNLKYSALRAAAVLEFLVGRGIAPERLSSTGFGETRPLVEGDSEHALFMNRRVEFIVTREREVRDAPSEPAGGGPGAPSAPQEGAP